MLSLEKDPGNQSLVNEIFRAAHSIKGGASYLNLARVIEFTHKLENILDNLRKGMLLVTPAVVDVLFHATDVLKQLINCFVQNGNDEGVDIQKIMGELATIEGPGGVDTKKKKEKPAPEASSGGGSEESTVLDVFYSTGMQHLDVLEAVLREAAAGKSGREQYDRLFRAFCGIKTASVVMQEQGLKDLADRAAQAADQLRQGLLKESPAVLEFFQKILEVVHRHLERKRKDPSIRFDAASLLSEAQYFAPASGTVAGRTEGGAEGAVRVQGEQTIRVGEGKLDHMMNLIAELIIVRNRFNILSKSDGGRRDVSLEDLGDATATFSRISNELQLLIMDIRMIPISTVFNKFPRMVRDFAKAASKKIELVIEGEQTALDKSVIEKIGDPLVHLVRNAIDHGIEPPGPRAKSGKSETGKVRLAARNEGENVVVEVEDDGRGMDPEALKRSAIAKGLISEEKARSMSPEEAIDLIFEPGFSTAETVTDISGRGVGMDVVKSNIKRLNGEITIKTEVKKGSLISIRLPMSLAIVKVLMTGVGNALYSFPLSSVGMTVRVSAQDVFSLGAKGKAIHLHGKTVMVEPLSDLLGLPAGPSVNGKISIVLLAVADKQFGVLVDRFYEQQEIVVKPLEGLLNTPCISGSAVLGNGRICLVVDVVELMKLALLRHEHFSKERGDPHV